MSLEQARIKELEQTVEELVAYLRRLPLNPDTYHRANEAEAILTKEAQQTLLRGATFLPSGIAFLGVDLMGLATTVQTQDVSGMPDRFQHEHKDRLYSALVRGIPVQLSAKTFDRWEAFFAPVNKD